ncbi:MBL fold metallo-hydrolase [Halodesulfovibrio marinisediminis]|uniref:7,8-dihydropterin-6-yl-methyl-4-(Beta-D-ribofuranosyl)aminobenzene 5'-phosphate synthase n=1 Tax=Halodesulfovibrio marinisediminis DSM 17456 TaxID=1121457 RepID=A0A1N6E7M3_9BACT|nr:MBL fold metallo-hydrolase [Halodesulfovibrio marinisediminis]SIN78971.1 7,8-dihydropterin-6-yl-methyl-4-(beta-D-ribofuranosyl)aminobenzene 5'-phosphate synthase [Halodesulfovibrio marinisediminis DSM 17456]
MLTLTVLIENISLRDNLIPTKGLSILLEDGDERLLLDTGTDGAFLKNAKALGISLNDIDQIALSHGHYDHAGGIPALCELFADRAQQPTLTCHPDCFIERHLGKLTGGQPVLVRKLDAGLDEGTVRKCFNVYETKEPQPIGSKFLFLGEIPRNSNFKGCGAFGIAKHEGKFVDDFLYDDTGIVWKGQDGLVIITGCSHSGICNIIERAQEVTGEKRIAAIVGGLHLHAASIPHLYQIRRFFKQVGVQRSHACHCTGKWGALWLPDNKPITTGDVLTFK